MDNILGEKPELVGENIRAMSFAAKESRVLIQKRDSVMKGLMRQPVVAKERWGLVVEHILRYEPEVEGQMELFSDDDSEQIHE